MTTAVTNAVNPEMKSQIDNGQLLCFRDDNDDILSAEAFASITIDLGKVDATMKKLASAIKKGRCAKAGLQLGEESETSKYVSKAEAVQTELRGLINRNGVRMIFQNENLLRDPSRGKQLRETLRKIWTAVTEFDLFKFFDTETAGAVAGILAIDDKKSTTPKTPADAGKAGGSQQAAEQTKPEAEPEAAEQTKQEAEQQAAEQTVPQADSELSKQAVEQPEAENNHDVMASDEANCWEQFVDEEGEDKGTKRGNCQTSPGAEEVEKQSKNRRRGTKGK